MSWHRYVASMNPIPKTVETDRQKYPTNLGWTILDRAMLYTRAPCCFRKSQESIDGAGGNSSSTFVNGIGSRSPVTLSKIVSPVFRGSETFVIFSAAIL